MPRGGFRVGAGRPRKGTAPKPKLLSAAAIEAGGQSPLEYMLDVMRDASADPRMRLEAAKAAAVYMHPKEGAAGKKEQRQDSAQRVAVGKFAPAAPPKLVVNNVK